MHVLISEGIILKIIDQNTVRICRIITIAMMCLRGNYDILKKYKTSTP